MVDIAPLKKNISISESQFRAAVSESFAQKIGGAINFINDYQMVQKQFFVNGPYNNVTIPFYAFDGLEYAEVKIEIVDAFMFCRGAGSGGDTQLDVEYALTPGGVWTSIFATKPAINFAAGDFAWTNIGASYLNTTAPVLGTTTIPKGAAIRMNMLTAQTGDARGCGLILFYKPSN